MAEIYQYSIAILVCVAVFGAVIGLLRLRHARKIRLAEGVIQKLEGTADGEPVSQELAESEPREEDLEFRPALWGIPYLAWILTSMVISLAFMVLFFENLVSPFSIPTSGAEASIEYRAPAPFEWRGRSFSRHQLLVSAGAPVTESDRQLIARALETRASIDAGTALGTLLILAVFSFILLYHMNILYPTSTEKNKNLILIYLTVLLVLVSAKASLFYGIFSPYLIPVPWAGMMITILINRRIVPLIMLITLICISLSSQFDFGLFLVLLSGGLTSGTWVRKARRRSDLLVASLMVGSIMSLVYLCQMGLTGSFVVQFSDLVAVFSNGILAGLLTLIFLPLFELLFDFASPFRLMELLDLNTPVLKDFFFKAPGTYQHTVVVANIAETVANEIGANGLLVRVGAYYHDIGKMFNPHYFIENQAGGENPHDSLGPVASAAVVRSHVLLGLKLAREVGLPGAVVDFITEHHGTSTIDYFYYKSRKLESEMRSDKVFRYPGPKPRSRETAVVMIVDSVEAAIRVVDSREEEVIREVINRIAQRKLEQGELDNSGLTIGEFQQIVDTLTHIIKSTRHQRIEYPQGSTHVKPEGAPLRVVSPGGGEADTSK